MKLIKPQRIVYVGIDASSKLLPFVAFDGDPNEVEPFVRLVKLSDTAGPRACRNGYVAVRNIIGELADPSLKWRIKACIEGVAIYEGGRGKAAVSQAYTVGAWQAALYEFGASIEFVPPGRWKKRVLGNGGLDKRGVAAGVRHRWPDHYRLVEGSQDLIDAYCLARYAASGPG